VLSLHSVWVTVSYNSQRNIQTFACDFQKLPKFNRRGFTNNATNAPLLTIFVMFWRLHVAYCSHSCLLAAEISGRQFSSMASTTTH